jgi:ribosomal protein S18 acetylase RimI-like enzyme
MRYLRRFNESFDNIEIVQCDKSRESYDFVVKHLDILDFDAYINNENLYQICAYDNDKLVGVSIFRMKDSKIHMNYSSVDESYRNQGINKKMKLKIIEIGKENGCTVITSNVRQSNVSSLKSQQGVGFKVNDRVDLTYPDGEKKLPLYLHL